MGQLLLMLVVALTVAAVVFGVTVLVTGRDPGLVPAEPDGRAVPLPGNRPLHESDVEHVRFDTALRGYRMAEVDQAMRRAAYDIGYKSELIGVLEAEVVALREGRTADADALRRAREQAAGGVPAANGVVAVPGAPRGDAAAPGDGPADATTAAPPAAERPSAGPERSPVDTDAAGAPASGGPGEPDAPEVAPSPVDAAGAAARGRPADGSAEPGPVVRSESV
ncbi:DivIVA domain-containing protein [Micromonospora sp. URMC 103]|uniref:DivIVA domain-containing protein n=1 Tax=Micromonospora sp. URMC 103 TaxID=3423406 RepID=UPI003F1BEE1C